MANETGGVSAVSNPFAPDVFADEAVGFELINGTVRISFGVVKMAEPVPPSDNQLVVIGRLILPVESAERMLTTLHGLLEQQGRNPSATARGGEKPN